MSREKVRVGIVGCGVVATAYYLPYLMKMEEAELVAVCDTYPERTAACVRLFGAQEAYDDYYRMLEEADIDVVFILTGPGTHVPFTLRAVEAGKHVLIQKPMALRLEEANVIVEAVRKAGVKVLVEPSSNSPLDPNYPPLRKLIEQGVLGDPYWFTWMPGVPAQYHPSLGGNPYGIGAFYTKDSGGMLMDFPYAPTQIVSLLGSCKSVTGLAKISVPDRHVVPDTEYNKFLAQATDPDNANYWDVVVDLPKTQQVQMEAEDNVFSLYEMANGAIGVFHIARAFHPMPVGAGGGGLRIFGTEGNLALGVGGKMASIISTRTEMLPSVDAKGWYHVPDRSDRSKAKWPKPTPGSFNYYHESTQHLIDCILQDHDPVVNVEWGRHITEMMVGALESSRSGVRHEMTTTLTGLVADGS
ncbi:MAG: Gfo/Idh/MocA family oxidoreductase [Caldilineaceae bacterium]|nr:Gfo/Idh/MocA family oxidoreductase [Caldilineaceae bacterium]